MTWRVMMTGLLAAVLFLSGCGGKQSEPAIEVTAMQDGRNLVVLVKTTGYRVGKDGHIHVYINDGPEAMLHSQRYTVEDAEPGDYKIRVELADRSHTNIGVGQTVEIEIKP